MPSNNIIIEVHSALREKPQDFEGDGEVGGNRPYSGKETIAYPLIDYLRRIASYTRKRQFEPQDSTFEVDLYRFRIGNSFVKVRYYGVNEESDWPFSYPEKEVLEIKVSNDFRDSLMSKLRELFPNDSLVQSTN
jgi:hypothetical protein